MKFEVNTEDFLRAASVATRFVERRANLPILASVLLVVQKGRVTLRATNLECGVELVLDAKVSAEGVVAVPGATLMGFLGSARGKVVRAELSGEVLKLSVGSTAASIKTLPHEEFPTLPRVAASTSLTIKAPDLLRALKNVAYCASTSTVKPELQSILLHGEGGKLTAAATDSFRLAEKIVPLRGSSTIPQLLLPARNANELARILEGASGEVELYYNEHQLSTHLGGVYYTSRLIDGAFPNYHQIVPNSFGTEAVVLREDFANALKALSTFSDKFSQISFNVDPARKALLLSSRNPDVGEEVVELRATISGDSVSMNFNSRYLADSLQGITGESVRVELNGPGKPILIKDTSDASFFYLVMPMNR